MKGIYLFANRARHENHDIIYNDVEKKYNCDITADALSLQIGKCLSFLLTPP